MKHSYYRLLLHLLLFSLLFENILLLPEGFAPGTLIKTAESYVPIEYIVPGIHIISHNKTALPVTYTKKSIVSHYKKITYNNQTLCLSARQRLFCVNRHVWISAHNIKPLDQLLCLNGKIVTVEEIATIHDTQNLHALSVATDHTFCIGPDSIIVHNFEPIITATTAVITLNIGIKVAITTAALLKTAVFSVVGIFIYTQTRKNKSQPKGCFQPTESLDQNCQFPIPEPINQNCHLPITEPEKSAPHIFPTSQEINPQPTGCFNTKDAQQICSTTTCEQRNNDPAKKQLSHPPLAEITVQAFQQEQEKPLHIPEEENK